jgi:hypothetical protein
VNPGAAKGGGTHTVLLDDGFATSNPLPAYFSAASKKKNCYEAPRHGWRGVFIFVTIFSPSLS